MRWADVAQAVSHVAAADSVLAAIHGEAIRAGGDSDYAVPSLEYHVITEGLADDIWAPVIIQWDIRTDTLEQLVQSELTLRELFDLGEESGPVPLVGGLRMWSVYDGDAELVGPDRPGTFSKALRFKHTPVRRSHATTT